jgi:hypothetical protein
MKSASSLGRTWYFYMVLAGSGDVASGDSSIPKIEQQAQRMVLRRSLHHCQLAQSNSLIHPQLLASKPFSRQGLHRAVMAMTQMKSTDIRDIRIIFRHLSNQAGQTLDVIPFTACAKAVKGGTQFKHAKKCGVCKSSSPACAAG